LRAPAKCCSWICHAENGWPRCRAQDSCKYPARIVIITTFTGDERIFRSLKPCDGLPAQKMRLGIHQIIEAVRTVSPGEQLHPVCIASKAGSMRSATSNDPRSRSAPGMAGGASNKEIGVALFISEGTVKTHVKSVSGEAGRNQRTEA